MTDVQNTTGALDPARTPRLGLVLGGGGMKGLAHVGALTVIEACGLRPERVSGTSIGALVGALYASGMSVEAMKQLLKNRQPLSLFSFRFDGRGFVGTNALRKFLVTYLGDRSFADLHLPLLMVTVDLTTGEEIILDSGPVVDAVLASTAIPGVFAPIERGNQLLVDGGLKDNLPIEPLLQRGATHTVAVQLFYTSKTHWRAHRGTAAVPPPTEAPDPKLPRPGTDLDTTWTARIAERVMRSDRLMPAAFNTAQRALDILMMQLEAIRLEACPPNVLISPELTQVGILDFHEDRQPIYEAGVQAAERQRDALLRLSETMARGGAP